MVVKVMSGRHSLLADGDWREHALLNVDRALLQAG